MTISKNFLKHNVGLIMIIAMCAYVELTVYTYFVLTCIIIIIIIMRLFLQQC